MKINKEEIVMFFKQNIKSIFLAFFCSIVVIGIGLYYFNHSKIEDYNDISFSNHKSDRIDTEEKNDDKHDEKIFVDVKGAVRRPGVFETTKDKRQKGKRFNRRSRWTFG